MSAAVIININAVVDRNEQAAVSMAATLLEENLSAAAGKPIAVRCQFDLSFDELISPSHAGLIVTSLLPEVANYEESWALVEHRLRKRYQKLAGSDGAVVFLCTILRHVPVRGSSDHARLIRIRRLNLLAAEISRETGAFVVDIDRSLADVGASKLATDYRLEGEYASQAAAKFIALAVLSVGLDDYVAFETQDAAKNNVLALKLNLRWRL